MQKGARLARVGPLSRACRFGSSRVRYRESVSGVTVGVTASPWTEVHVYHLSSLRDSWLVMRESDGHSRTAWGRLASSILLLSTDDPLAWENRRGVATHL